MCCSPWGRKESYTSEWLNRTELIYTCICILFFRFFSLIGYYKILRLISCAIVRFYTARSVNGAPWRCWCNDTVTIITGKRTTPPKKIIIELMELLTKLGVLSKCQWSHLSFITFIVLKRISVILPTQVLYFPFFKIHNSFEFLYSLSVFSYIYWKFISTVDWSSEQSQ